MPVVAAALVPARVTLGVADLDRSEAFYRDVLGLEVRRTGDAVRVEAPGFTLLLESAPPAERGKFIIGFRVAEASEVDAWAARLTDAGTGVMSGPADDTDGRRTLVTRDPDDYRIEIFA